MQHESGAKLTLNGLVGRPHAVFVYFGHFVVIYARLETTSDRSEVTGIPLEEDRVPFDVSK